MKKLRLTKLQKVTLCKMLEREIQADASFEAANARALGGLSGLETLIRRCTMSGESNCAYRDERASRWVCSSHRTFRALGRLGLIEHKGNGWYLLTSEGRATAERLRASTRTSPTRRSEP